MVTHIVICGHIVVCIGRFVKAGGNIICLIFFNHQAATVEQPFEKPLNSRALNTHSEVATRSTQLTYGVHTKLRT